MSVTSPSTPVPTPAPAAVAGAPSRRSSLLTRLDRPWVVALGVLALTVLAGLLRLRALSAAFWLDEAQAVDIAARPLHDLPHLLRLDGSPPLYYALLHVWMRAFGRSEFWVHLLSVGFAALCAPAAWVAGRLAHSARAGWLAGAVMAFNPFVSTYADQARMYTLLALLALLVVALFLAAFVHRRRAAVPAFSVALALALLTHNWSFFLAAGCVAGFLVLWNALGRERSLLAEGAVGFGLAGLLYLPWLPELLDQIRKTGAPWSVHPTIKATLRGIEAAPGGAGPGMLLVLAGGAGVVALLRARPATPQRATIIALTVLTAATLVVALAFCAVSLAWAPRYLAVLVGPFTVLAAAGMAASGGLGIAATVLVVVLTVGQPSTHELDDKTNVSKMARYMNADLRKGDLVISTQPEQVPALVRYLRPGLRYATPTGRVPNPRIMDWRHALARMRSATPRRDLAPLLRALPRGGHVLLVNPVTAPQGLRSHWARAVRNRKREWAQLILHDRRLHRIRRFVTQHSRWSAASGQLFVKR